MRSVRLSVLIDCLLCRPTLFDGDDIKLDEDESDGPSVYTIISVISAVFVVSFAMWIIMLAYRKSVSEKGMMQESPHDDEADTQFDDQFAQ